MTKRFFKLLYTLILIAIVIWLPIHVLSSIRWDTVVLSSYKAKCLSNNQYVVLQGSSVGDITIWDEDYLNSSESHTTIKEQLNFYCKYYDQIQMHIATYNEAKTPSERVSANQRFVAFENSKDKVYAYPELYKLETVNEEFRPQEIYNPILDGVVFAAIAFTLLQIIRVCYVYVVYGKLVWHPFKNIQDK